MQTITPYLLYEDAAAAVDWLTRAFGFTERLRYTEDDGTVSHAELEMPGGGEVMLGQPGEDYESPSRSGRVSVYIHVSVPDVDVHFAQAKEAGATIESVPEDQPYGDRRYNCSDLEGHRWSFAQKMRDVPPSEWGATTA
jgi:uncharacterized glyoxalase superfamily protein PhnB